MINNQKYKLQIIYILFVVLLFISVTVCKAADGVIVLTISAHEETSGPEILLKDIARIEGASPFQNKILNKISLGDAARPGFHRTINKQQIIAKIKEKGLSREDYKINMPSLVTVKTRYIYLAAEHIVVFVENYIKKNLPYPEEKIKIKTTNIIDQIKIPDQMYTVEVLEKNPDKLLGNVSLPVLIKCNDEPWKKIYVGLDIKVIQEVYIARRNYIYGQKLQREDFQKKTKELAEVKGDLILDWNNPLVKNGIIRVPLGRGVVLTTHYLKKSEQNLEPAADIKSEKLKIDNIENKQKDTSELDIVTISSNEAKEEVKPYIINWGNKVRAEVIAGKVTVSAAVKACQRGKKGEYITVENLKTGYRFQAKVISSQLVQVKL